MPRIWCAAPPNSEWIDGGGEVDMKRVKARKDAISGASRTESRSG